jgi:GGDEF domain-containing protein
MSLLPFAASCPAALDPSSHAEPTRSARSMGRVRVTSGGKAAPVRGLPSLAPYVADPITRLVAFPCFHQHFPTAMAQMLAEGNSAGIAIGDVDNLKRYVERSRALHELNFGHLAGNALMTRLGEIALEWFEGQGANGCVATFGGDEIILALTTDHTNAFGSHVRELARVLCAQLPCSVSFAHATFCAGASRVPLSSRHYQLALALVDRALFRAKGRAGSPRVVNLRQRVLERSGWRVGDAERGGDG